MDEVVGLLAEQIAKRIRAARQNAAAQAAQAGQPAALPPGAPLRRSAPAAVRAQPALLPPATPATAVDPLMSRRLRRDMPPQVPVTLPTLDAVLAPPAPNSAGAGSALLAAFRGGPPLLGAIVLGEALGPPLSLQPFDARLR